MGSTYTLSRFYNYGPSVVVTETTVTRPHTGFVFLKILEGSTKIGRQFQFFVTFHNTSLLKTYGLRTSMEYDEQTEFTTGHLCRRVSKWPRSTSFILWPYPSLLDVHSGTTQWNLDTLKPVKYWYGYYYCYTVDRK